MTPEREKKSGVCIHGALRRQCETCDLAEQLEALEARCKALERAAHLADLLWREASKVERGDESYYETSPRLMELMADALAAPPPPRQGRRRGGKLRVRPLLRMLWRTWWINSPTRAKMGNSIRVACPPWSTPSRFSLTWAAASGCQTECG